MSKNILLIGGGGHCKSVLDTIIENNDYDNIGIIDKEENIGKKILGIDIIGKDEDIPYLYKNGYRFAFISLGSIGSPKIRINLFDMISEIGFEIPSIIDKSADISKYSRIEKGVFIGKKSVINAGSIIKKGSIINTGAIVEHDCTIGSFVHIASGSVLGGNVNIDDNSHIGSNATIRNGINIGKNTIIGIGSVVTKDIGDNVIAYGNPCKIISQVK